MKTDVKDAEWICDLLRHGLHKVSFIPDPTRVSCWSWFTTPEFNQERSREHNRVQKVLEGANIKLAAEVSGIMGV